MTSIGTPRPRVDGPEKVTGAAAYTMDQRPADPLHAWLVQSTIARGRVSSVDAGAALGHPGVVAVLDHTNAPGFATTEDRELSVLQDDVVRFRGQVVACVLAETPEAARHGAELVQVTYDERPASLVFSEATATSGPDELDIDDDYEQGDLLAALRGAAHVVEATYRTPFEHNNPMEPHATVAQWHGDPTDDDGVVLTVHTSTQSVHKVAGALATLLGVDAGQVRVVGTYVGGGFGSKGLPHCHDAVAVLAARTTGGRPVKLAVTRQQMFALTGYRTATIQRLRLGADADGRLTAIEHRSFEQTATTRQFVEESTLLTRNLYAAASRACAHRVAVLDVAVPSWMRAPGEMPGAYGLESAMDELAEAVGLDPVELRIRNDTDTDPETGKPFSNRRLAECLRLGAERFGWSRRDPRPGTTVDGDWLVGLGMASATYPAYVNPGNEATIRALEPGRFVVEIGAADIGTGAWTVLGQIAADALDAEPADVEMRIGDTGYPRASVAGGSSGTASWGTAIVSAARAFRKEYGDDPRPGAETTAAAEELADTEHYALQSFGAHFVEARVHRLTGEIRVPRMLGVFSAGRIVNPVTARSQLIGGMTMGLSAALFEESWRDPRFGHVVTQDLASYHVAVHADVRDLEAVWLDEDDFRVTPMGARGIGEIGIVGSPAAVANAVHHATGIRVRDLPITPDKLVEPLAARFGS
ncbi:MAG TPA: xanthine dehydrogenase family protein molybdopterin-binding subunit [Marmoricola sp.]|nr:xanthine dehydrogenase family protein molybdopterin-binding subunit [Marmoricola sp.]